MLAASSRAGRLEVYYIPVCMTILIIANLDRKCGALTGNLAGHLKDAILFGHDAQSTCNGINFQGTRAGGIRLLTVNRSLFRVHAEGTSADILAATGNAERLDLRVALNTNICKVHPLQSHLRLCHIKTDADCSTIDRISIYSG